MSIESFAKRVVELMVAPTASSLLDCLREHQVPEAGIDESEVWIFSLFPFHTMGGLGHFREESRQFGYGLISGTAERMRNRTASTTEHIFERLAEYAQATFDAEELERGQLAILENGLFKIGKTGALAYNQYRHSGFRRHPCDWGTLHLSFQDLGSVDQDTLRRIPEDG